jgi:hypothetical protein
MIYKELRKKLREQGFINLEILTIHQQYLVVRAVGVNDDEIEFNREHGLVMNASGMIKYNAATGIRVAPDVQNDCAYIIKEGKPIKVGPFL